MLCVLLTCWNSHRYIPNWVWNNQPLIFPRSYLGVCQRSGKISGKGNVGAPFQNTYCCDLKFCRDFTNRTREPFAIKIIGRTFYTITAPAHVAAVYKATTALSFDSFLNEALHGFGLDAASIKLVWHKPSLGDACYHNPNPLNPQQKPFVHWIKDTYRQALLPGEKMNHMAAHFHRYIERNMQWKRVSSLAIQQLQSTGVVVLSLKDFSRKIMLEAITDSFFGDRLFQVEPNIVQYAAGFNDEAWMLVHRYPKILAGRVLHNRTKIMAALSKYRQIPKEERAAGGEAWAIETVMTAGELLGMSNESNDTFLMLIHWAYVIPVVLAILNSLVGQCQRQYHLALLLASLVHSVG